MAERAALPLARLVARSAALPAATLAMVLLMVAPLPALLLDVFFVANILLALVMLMIVLQARAPLDFSVFPTVLLYATMLRLALNVASTRIILVEGHTGTAAAGHVIEAFGTALIGGDFVVGLIVFAILMIVNLVVITKGAGRVSEVSARFTLDALPGKQMAIDADLNAGLLTPDEARSRRAEVAAEADFYGSMDGASKFVKGDAVAGILILLVNIVGGLLIGTLTHGMPLGEAASTYLLLTVGDGLVSQVPALLLSIAAAVLVTRSTDRAGLDSQLAAQFGSRPAWIATAAIFLLLSAVPAMPGLALAPAAALAGLVAWRTGQSRPAAAPAPAAADPALGNEVDPGEVTEQAVVTLDLGYGLLGLVDERRGGQLMSRLTGVRRQLSRDLGFVLPLIRVRDDIGLAPHRYRLTIAGEVVGSDEVMPDDLLALLPAEPLPHLPGRDARDPSFGLPARWIDPADEATATAGGCTVVDATTALATHVHRLLTVSAARLFDQDEAQALVDRLAQSAPQLAVAIGPKTMPLRLLTAILRNLLDERVPLRDLRRIAGAVAEVAGHTDDPAAATEAVRASLGGLIVERIAPFGTVLGVVTLAPDLEELLAAGLRAGSGSPMPFDPALSGRVTTGVAEAVTAPMADGRAIALVTQPLLRRALVRILRSSIPDLPVLAFTELPDHRAVDVLAVVGRTTAHSEPLMEPAA